MPIFRGTYYSRVFQFNNSLGPINITGWEFESDLRGANADEPPLLTLNSANGGWVIEDGLAGRLRLNILAAQTVLLTGGKCVFDVLRTDTVPGPVWLFAASVPVKQPITRD